MVTVTIYGRHNGAYLYSEKMTVKKAVAYTEWVTRGRAILVIWT